MVSTIRRRARCTRRARDILRISKARMPQHGLTVPARLPAKVRAIDTERRSPRYSGIDLWTPSDILDAMLEGQFAAVGAVRTARPAIERAALAMEKRLS